jgi:spermidine synthase
MPKHKTGPTPAAESPPRFLPALLLLFAGSGAAALIYEVVWFQLVQLVIGSSGVSLGVLLGTFMGGMFLGSLLLPRFIPAGRHPLRVYAVLEAGIGLFGVLLLLLIPLAGGAYSAIVGRGFGAILLRAFVCALLLLPPTVLMGATLPAIARWIETTPRGVAWMGFFYGGNIAGAVVGCVLAGFYLLRVHDATTATFVALALNLAVAGAAWALAGFQKHRVPAVDAPAPAPVFTRESRFVYVAIGLSGLTALGAQVIWTRLLSLLLGATVYTFSIILAVFLTGLGLGSGVGSYMAKTVQRPRVALGVCQFLLVLAIAWTAFMLARSLPYWPINPSITSSPLMLFQIDLVRAAWAIFPATVLWGASFPLAVAAAASKGQDPARLLGGVYAANTVGAIVGAVGFGMVVIPWLGTQAAHQIAIALASVSALLLLFPALAAAPADAAAPAAGMVPARHSPATAARAGVRPPSSPRTAGTPPAQAAVDASERTRRGSGAGRPVPARSSGRALWLAIPVFATLLLVRAVPDVPPVLIAYGRYAATYDPPNALYIGEGMNASVAVTELANGDRNFHVSGKIEASTEPQDMRLQRMLGHLTALLHEQPRTVLVVGFGAGVTAGTFVTHPSVERIVICEIEPLIPQVVSRYFAEVNHHVLSDPRVEVIYDDARHYLLTTDEKFDVITSDPIHPWVKGAAALYTKEYFDLARRHLNPGGVMTQWVPLYESTEDVVKSEVATFFDVFPNGTIWGNDIDGRGYDVVLAAKDGPMTVDVSALQQRLDGSDHNAAAISLAEVGFTSVFALLSTYAGQGPDLKDWLADADINTDRSLRLMYIAGMGLNRYEQSAIYEEMLRRRRFPEELFAGSGNDRELLRSILSPY